MVGLCAGAKPPAAEPAPWLQNVTVDVPSRQHTVPERLRPLIYVYDLPAEYHSRMIQYRVVKVWLVLHLLIACDPEQWQASDLTALFSTAAQGRQRAPSSNDADACRQLRL